MCTCLCICPGWKMLRVMNYDGGGGSLIAELVGKLHLFNMQSFFPICFRHYDNNNYYTHTMMPSLTGSLFFQKVFPYLFSPITFI